MCSMRQRWNNIKSRLPLWHISHHRTCLLCKSISRGQFEVHWFTIDAQTSLGVRLRWALCFVISGVCSECKMTRTSPTQPAVSSKQDVCGSAHIPAKSPLNIYWSVWIRMLMWYVSSVTCFKSHTLLFISYSFVIYHKIAEMTWI